MIGVLAFIAVVVAYVVTESGLGTNPSGTVGLQAQSTPLPSPGTGRVTMIDLGATECIPCKMMAPILEVFRHIGFMDKQRIVDILFKLGVS
jgi:thioredoxin 1